MYRSGTSNRNLPCKAGRRPPEDPTEDPRRTRSSLSCGCLRGAHGRPRRLRRTAARIRAAAAAVHPSCPPSPRLLACRAAGCCSNMYVMMRAAALTEGTAFVQQQLLPRSQPSHSSTRHLQEVLQHGSNPCHSVAALSEALASLLCATGERRRPLFALSFFCLRVRTRFRTSSSTAACTHTGGGIAGACVRAARRATAAAGVSLY